MTPVVLPALLDLAAARALVAMLRGMSGPVLLDGSEVERIGVAGLQLLLSARAAATAAGESFALCGPSPALAAAARTAGAAILLASDR